MTITHDEQEPNGKRYFEITDLDGAKAGFVVLKDGSIVFYTDNGLNVYVYVSPEELEQLVAFLSQVVEDGQSEVA